MAQLGSVTTIPTHYTPRADKVRFTGTSGYVVKGGQNAQELQTLLTADNIVPDSFASVRPGISSHVFGSVFDDEGKRITPRQLRNAPPNKLYAVIVQAKELKTLSALRQRAENSGMRIIKFVQTGFNLIHPSHSWSQSNLVKWLDEMLAGIGYA